MIPSMLNRVKEGVLSRSEMKQIMAGGNPTHPDDCYDNNPCACDEVYDCYRNICDYYFSFDQGDEWGECRGQVRDGRADCHSTCLGMG